MNWQTLSAPEQLEDINKLSESVPVLFFKHSTRCSVSAMAKRKLESEWRFSDNQIIPYHLDLLANRTVSNKIAEDYSVNHQSPQVLLIKNGKCIFHASHHDIDADDIAPLL